MKTYKTKSKKTKTKKTKTKKTKKLYKKYIPKNITTQANIPRMQRLRYTSYEFLQANAGAISTRTFRANSVYDPDYAVGGNMCMRHAQMSDFYADYVVIGSKITVKQIGGSNASICAPAMLWAYLNDVPTFPFTDYTQFIENGKIGYKLVSDSTANRLSISNKFSAKKFFNIANIKDNVARIGCPVAQNPPDEAYFNVCCQALDGSSSVSLNLFVVIDYLVLYSQPKNLTL